MFEEAQLYAPVTRSGDDVTVHLGDDHPGAVDPEYRARRNALAALAMDWQPGTPPPIATYTDAEQEVWRIVCAELHNLHQRLACAAYLEGKQRLQLPEDKIPQLVEVNELLKPLTGFQYVPAAGLVPLLEFYGTLATASSTPRSTFAITPYRSTHQSPMSFMRSSAMAIAWHTIASTPSTGWRGRQLAGCRRPRPWNLSRRSSGSRWSLVWYASTTKSALTALVCSPRTERSSKWSELSSGRWTSDGWAFRPTTSLIISRCCSVLRDSMRSRTWWARSSPKWMTS
jgi:hypothetical protein